MNSEAFSFLKRYAHLSMALRSCSRYIFDGFIYSGLVDLNRSSQLLSEFKISDTYEYIFDSRDLDDGTLKNKSKFVYYINESLPNSGVCIENCTEFLVISNGKPGPPPSA